MRELKVAAVLVSITDPVAWSLGPKKKKKKKRRRLSKNNNRAWKEWNCGHQRGLGIVSCKDPPLSARSIRVCFRRCIRGQKVSALPCSATLIETLGGKWMVEAGGGEREGEGWGPGR